MVDFAMDVFKHLYPDKDVPKELKEKRTAVVAELKRQQQAVQPITEILGKEEVMKQIETSRDGRQLFETLAKDHKFKSEYLDDLYDYAKFQYECGNYSGASEYLYFHRVLAPPSDKNFMNALWGKLASEILMQNWEAALEEVNRIKEIIDAGGAVGGMSLGGMGNALQALQQRAWLIHWSLFVFFNHPKGERSYHRPLLVSAPISQHDTNHLPAHPTVSDNGSHHQQEAEACHQGSSQSHPTRVLHLQRPNHRVYRMPLRFL